MAGWLYSVYPYSSRCLGICAPPYFCQLEDFTNKEKISLSRAIFFSWEPAVVLKAIFLTKRVGAESGESISLNLIYKHKIQFWIGPLGLWACGLFLSLCHYDTSGKPIQRVDSRSSALFLGTLLLACRLSCTHPHPSVRTLTAEFFWFGSGLCHWWALGLGQVLLSRGSNDKMSVVPNVT